MTAYLTKVITQVVVALLFTKYCTSMPYSKYSAVNLCKEYNYYTNNTEEIHAVVDEVCPPGLMGGCNVKTSEFDNGYKSRENVGICSKKDKWLEYDSQLDLGVPKERITIVCITEGGLIWDHVSNVCKFTGPGMPPVPEDTTTTSSSETSYSNRPETSTSPSQTLLSDAETYHDASQLFICHVIYPFNGHNLYKALTTDRDSSADVYRSLTNIDRIINMKVGEVFEVIGSEEAKGWTRVRTTNRRIQQEGLVPTNHIQCYIKK